MRAALENSNIKQIMAPKLQLSSLLSRSYLHIKNMEIEKKRAEIQKNCDEAPLVEEYERVYKPTYTLEFNRTGEILLYSCDPFKHKEIYFKYPYVFYESLIPASLFMFVENPLGLSYGASYLFFLMANMLWFPRVWQFHSMQYRIRRASLLRGGRVIKFERITLAGDELVNWVEVKHSHPLTENFKDFDDRDEAEFLNEAGQLKYELACEFDHFKQWGVNDQDVDVFFMKEGTVHHPEIFEAVVKGYHVDTSNFVINTAFDERALEPHHTV